MPSIASCGHRLTHKEIITINPINVRGVDRDGTRTVKCLVLCPKCEKLARVKGCVLHTIVEEQLWLEGKKEGAVW